MKFRITLTWEYEPDWDSGDYTDGDGVQLSPEEAIEIDAANIQDDPILYMSDASTSWEIIR